MNNKFLEGTIPAAFSETAAKNKKKTALLFKEKGRYSSISYFRLQNETKKFARVLNFFKIGVGDKVAILSENRPEWAIADLGTMLAGGIVVPIHSSLNSALINHILKDSEAKILVVSSLSLLNKTLASGEKLVNLQKIILIEPTQPSDLKNLEKSDEIFSWKSLMSKTNIINSFQLKVNAKPDDICTIVYTSGTTGLPKGVLLSHRNILSDAENVYKLVPVKRTDVFLSFLPLSHMLERLAGYYLPLLFGASIAYSEEIKQLPKNLKEVKPTILICVPRIFEKFHDAVWDNINKSFLKKKLFILALNQNVPILKFFIFKKVRENLGGRIRLAISGGARLDADIAKFFKKVGVAVLEGYGLTETSPVISVNQEKDFKFGTVGKVLPHLQVSISSDREILVKGDSVAQGYYKQDKKSFCDDNGWFHTGDLGFFDEENFLVVSGRKKEMMVTSGGENIWPEAVESKINSDKYVTQSMIVCDDKKFVSALIYPDWEEVEGFLKNNDVKSGLIDQMIKQKEVLDLFEKRINQINEGLAGYEKIKKFFLIGEEFSQEKGELTPTLKLRRQIIEKRYKDEINFLYEKK